MSTASTSTPAKLPVIETAAFIKPREITTTDLFKLRSGKSDRAHVKTILNGMNIRGDVAPVLLWREITADGPTGRLVLIDGQHRLEAFAFNLRGKDRNDPLRKRGISAIILDCDLQQALQRAISSNTNDSLPLTNSERANAAWKLVRMFGLEMSKVEISITAGVGRSTVQRMRTRFKEMTMTDAPISGIWGLDREGDHDANDNSPSLTAAEFEAEVMALYQPLRVAFGMRPKRDACRDAEVLRRVFGSFYLKQVITEALSTHDEPSSVEAAPLLGDIETGATYLPSLDIEEDEFAHLV